MNTDDLLAPVLSLMSDEWDSYPSTDASCYARNVAFFDLALAAIECEDVLPR